MTTEFDVDYIDIMIAMGPRTSGPPTVHYERCAWCAHSWHGLPCRALVDPVCSCESALLPRDDTWRPSLTASDADQVLRLMHETGVDGWAAQRCVGPVMPGRTSPSIMAARLYGTLS